MYRLAHVINTVLGLAAEQKIMVNSEKLNAMLYKIYMLYIKKTGAPLFADGFLASERGPVLENMNGKTHRQQNRPVKQWFMDEDGETVSVDLSNDKDLKEICHSVLSEWGSKEATWVMLSNARDGSAWKRARIKHLRYLDDGDILREA